MDKNNITKSQFAKFKKLRRSGRINMTDIRNGAILIGESEDVYETIMWNYSYLETSFMAKQKAVKIPDEIFSNQFLKFVGLYVIKFKASNGYGKWLVEYQKMEDAGMLRPEKLKELYINVLEGSFTESYIIKDAVNYICSQALDATKAYTSANLFDIRVITGEIALDDNDNELICMTLEDALSICKTMNEEAEEFLFKVYYHNTKKPY